VSSIRDFSEDKSIVQITAPISPGSSGSPVINSEGHVFGVATFSRIDGQNLNFAVPIGYILNSERTEEPIEVFAEKSKVINILEAKEYADKGIALSKMGNIREAINYMSLAIEKDPNNAKYYIGRGNFYIAMKDRSYEEHQKGITDLEHAKKLAPDYFLSYKLLGTAYMQIFLNYNRSMEFIDLACENFTKLCQLGDCEKLIILKADGVCH